MGIYVGNKRYALYTGSTRRELLLSSVELPKMTAVFDVKSTSSETKLFYQSSMASSFKKIEVDSSPITIAVNYLFSSFGEHTVDYTIADSTTIIANMFRACVDMKSVSLPSGFTTVNGYGFQGITSLESVSFPETITTIGSQCFANCTNLKTFVITATTPPTLGSNAFRYATSIAIYVPDDSVDSYKTSWSSHSGKIRALSTLT